MCELDALGNGLLVDGLEGAASTATTDEGAFDSLFDLFPDLSRFTLALRAIGDDELRAVLDCDPLPSVGDVDNAVEEVDASSLLFLTGFGADAVETGDSVFGTSGIDAIST